MHLIRQCISNSTGRRVKMLKKRTRSGKGQCPNGAHLKIKRVSSRR